MTERERVYVETVFMAHGVYESEVSAAKRTLKSAGVLAYIDSRAAAERRRDEAEATAWAAYLAAGRGENGEA